jgi:glyoxylase-like metal-dependent hydrolase (beta-lactamase superfamily II)
MMGSLQLIARLLGRIVLALALAPLPAAAQGPAPTPTNREIVALTKDLYRVRDGDRHTVFLATPEGIVVGDPLSAEIATWLRDELGARFPGVPVRFVLHTHHHFDRAEGAALLRPGERIAQRAFNDAISDGRRRLPALLDDVDLNHDGVLDSGELAGSPAGPFLQTKDRDRDGRVLAEELYRQVQEVRRTFDRTMTVTVGGKNVEMVHAGRGHAVDMAVLFFQSERIVFAADPPPIATVPFVFGLWQPSDAFDWLRAVTPLEFDTLVLGDGRTMSRTDLVALSRHLDAVREVVVAGRERGATFTALRAARRPSPSDPHDAALDSQLGAIYRTLRLTRVLLTGAGGGAYSARSSLYCEGFSTCNTGGAAAAGLAALTFSRGRLGVGAEVQMGAQTWHARTSALRDDELALREARLSALLRYDQVGQGFTVGVVGGPSLLFGDSAGAYREKGAVAPLGGRHPLGGRGQRFGVTAGVDLTRALGSRVSLVVPLRFTRMFGDESATWPGTMTLSAGGGLSWRLARRVH